MKPEMIAEEFKKGFDCSQVVLSTFAPKLGISNEEAKKIAACFGGGMGESDGTCGAIIGAMIAIGMKYGHYDAEHMEQKDMMAAKRSEFLMKIKEKNPSILCKDILGNDLTKPEELAIILEKGTLFSVCPCVVSDVIKTLDEIM